MNDTGDFWKDAINSIPAQPLPDDGEPAPLREMFNNEINQMDQEGTLTKLSFDLFIFKADGQSYMINSFQRLYDYGEMTLGEALVRARRGKPRRS